MLVVRLTVNDPYRPTDTAKKDTNNDWKEKRREEFTAYTTIILKIRNDECSSNRFERLGAVAFVQMKRIRSVRAEGRKGGSSGKLNRK